MIYFIIITIFTVVSHLLEKVICILDNDIEKNLINKMLIFLPNIIIPILIYSKYGISSQSISYIALIPFLTIISVIDFRTTYVYDITILSGIIMQGIIFLFSKETSISNIKGLFIATLVSYILAKLTKSMGSGDIGVYGLCAFVLGYEYCMYMIFLSFVIASIYAIYAVCTKTKSIKQFIAFTPFISLATTLIILTQNDLINFYFDTLNKYI